MFKKHGFTLVEILLVIVIIGILAAIVIPRITYSRTEAQQAACKANIAALNSQIELYHYNTSNWPTNVADLVPDFIDAEPVCPVNASANYTIGSNHRIAHTH